MRAKKTHHKKSWDYLFAAAIRGDKTHDIRLNEGYEVGDIIRLHEYDNPRGEFTGRYCDFDIPYITSSVTNCAYSPSILKNEYVILSIRKAGVVFDKAANYKALLDSAAKLESAA